MFLAQADAAGQISCAERRKLLGGKIICRNSEETDGLLTVIAL